jgi:hypothetical protein
MESNMTFISTVLTFIMPRTMLATAIPNATAFKTRLMVP